MCSINLDTYAISCASIFSILDYTCVVSERTDINPKFNSNSELSVSLNMYYFANQSVSNFQILNVTNSVDPDETAPDEPSHLDLRSLQKFLYYLFFMAPKE